VTDYPFSAIVGQDEMKLALMLVGINPKIGGVLVSGVRGSGKSSAARGLANLLPPIRVNSACPFGCDPDEPCGQCSGAQVEERPTPFVPLPLGATEDRVLGTIDLEKAVRRGEKHFEPGLLARVNRGVLYVDEVNLLPDHLVDILLDVAVSGVNVVEREGISVRHPARFILIGTMNPEEGELRPQLLDRFGLSVEVKNLHDPVRRAEVARRTIVFESDPEACIRAWAGEESRLRERIVRARELLPQVAVPDEIAAEISMLCCREHVDGLRADIVIRKSAMALAASEGRTTVTREDVGRVSEFALVHRRTTPPGPPTPPPAPSAKRPETRATPEPSGLTQVEALAQGPVHSPEPDARLMRRAMSAGGRGGQERTGMLRGPYVRARLPRGPVTDLALDATLRAAVMGYGSAACEDVAISIRPGDLREKVRRTPYRRLYLFVLDASRSMGAHRRMALTKGVLLGLLDEAYQKRDQVGLITFCGMEAELVLPPTRSVRRVQQRVRDLPIGGRTPLARALRLSREALVQARRRHTGLALSLILVSDGRPTVGWGGADPVRSAERELRTLLRCHADFLFVDTEQGYARIGMMREWASRWGVPCVALEDLRPERVRQLLRAG